MSQTTIQLGTRIRRLRQARDSSQEQLAEYADLSLSYIALLEKGRKSATVEIAGPSWPMPSASRWRNCSPSAAYPLRQIQRTHR